MMKSLLILAALALSIQAHAGIYDTFKCESVVFSGTDIIFQKTEHVTVRRMQEEQLLNEHTIVSANLERTYEFEFEGTEFTLNFNKKYHFAQIADSRQVRFNQAPMTVNLTSVSNPGLIWPGLELEFNLRPELWPVLNKGLLSAGLIKLPKGLIVSGNGYHGIFSGHQVTVNCTYAQTLFLP